MTTPFKRPVTRATELYTRDRSKSKRVIARMTGEGIYMKFERSPWRTAYFISWAGAFDVARKNKAIQLRHEKAEKRKLRRLL